MRQVDSLDKLLGSAVKVLAKDGNTSQSDGRSLETGLLVSELLSDLRLQGEMERHGLQKCVLSPPSSDDFVRQRAMSAPMGHVEKDRPLCVAMSPTHSWLLDLAVKSLQLSRRMCHANKQFAELSEKPEKSSDPFKEYTPQLLMVVELGAGAS